MKLFENAKWIWANNSLDADDYAEFVFDVEGLFANATLNISADSNYAIFVNDELCKFMGCSDFPSHKFYDEIKLNLSKEINHIKIQVWHQGVGSSCYFVAKHGLIFELISDNKVIASSNENILSRVMNEFKNGLKKIITIQQGLSFAYDGTLIKNDYKQSILVDKECNFFKREINDLVLKPREKIEITKTDKSILIDLGKETAGLLELDFISSSQQDILITYGEHIVDGGVRRIIDARDFSVNYVAKKGENKFLNPLKRLAGRYLEVFAKDPIEINYIGLRSVNYVHEVIRKDYGNEVINKINNVCIDTLELCMHEHYEDCPWREQCLYILDSMNQMMCGYKVFKGFEYARHNIELISQSLNKAGFLAICSPSTDLDFTIPFFNLMFVKEVYEYIEASGDRTILDIAEKPIRSIMNNFASRLDNNNLVKFFERPNYWNFYEWVQESDNADVFDDTYVSKDQYDLIMNAAYVYAVSYYNRIFNENIDTSKIKEAIVKNFYDEEKNVYVLNTNTKAYSQLGNAFACLIGLGNDELLEKIKNDKNMIEASLSVRNFVYDSLLANKNNKDYVIKDIVTRYKGMLDKGATSFWETEEGEKAFNNAGSLCHGWSAIPIYYFDELLK